MTAKADTPPLREALQALVDLKDRFDRSNRNQADAYYALVKGADEKWEIARAALASEPVAGTVREAAVAEAYKLFPDETEPSEHPLGKIVVDRGSIRYGFLAGVNFALSLPPQGRGVELRCYGCGSAWTDDDLRAARAKDPQIISCCPERKPLNITEWMARAVAAEFNLRATPPAPGAADRAVIAAACRLVAADTYKHPVLSREDAVKAGVAELHDAVGKWHGAQPAALALPRADRGAGS